MGDEKVMADLAGGVRLYRTEEIETKALGGVDARIHYGEYVAVTGPSGCGKSTLLRVLGLIDRVDGGTYRFEGKDTAELSPDEAAALRNQRLGFVFQDSLLVDRMTVLENVGLPLVLRGRPKAEVEARAAVLLDSMGMVNRMHHYPSQLSGGKTTRRHCTCFGERTGHDPGRRTHGKSRL